MANPHTFHTPSFGDEEFHLPQIPSQMQNNSLIRGDMNVSGNVSASGGVQAVYNMTTTNINSSAADTRPAIVANPNNLSAQQWPMSNHPNSMRSASDVVTMTGNEFLVLRSPTQQVNPVSSSGDNINSGSMHATGVIDQTVSSDESDDNGVNKSGSRSPGAAAAIIDLKSRMKNDPNAPRKPVSAYALFFGDTQAAIKSQNPNASFGEISKIVASMWDVLAEEHKDVYKKKAEDAKKEYRRLLSIYRSNLLAQAEEELTRRGSTENATQITHNATPQQQIQPGAGNMTVLNVPVTAGVICINQNQPPEMTIASPTNALPPQNTNSGQNVDTEISNGTDDMPQGQMCIRNGCQNPAVVSPDWEDEYCSNECVVTHCAEIFSRWVKDYTAAETFAAS